MNNTKIRYFIIKDGRIWSCATDAKTLEEALIACDDVDGDSVIEISADQADFIASQF